MDGHKKLFGHYPESVAADKGYRKNKAAIKKLQENVPLVSVAKKGNRTDQEIERGADPAFRLAQRIRADVEGTISLLNKVLRWPRCYNKGWEHHAATVGATVLVQNLLILARN